MNEEQIKIIKQFAEITAKELPDKHYVFGLDLMMAFMLGRAFQQQEEKS